VNTTAPVAAPGEAGNPVAATNEQGLFRPMLRVVLEALPLDKVFGYFADAVAQELPKFGRANHLGDAKWFESTAALEWRPAGQPTFRDGCHFLLGD
jgi:hypothetical protein